MKQVQEAYIVAATRTPIGRSGRGYFKNTRPDDLLLAAVRGAMAQVPTLDPRAIEDSIIGCSFPEGEQGMNMARIVMGLAFPHPVGGVTVNRFCASGITAIQMAADRIRVGEADVLIAGGAEIHEYILKNWRLVKIATTKAQRKLFFNLRGMKQDSSTLQPAEVRSIAAQLGVKPEEVVEMETRLTGRDIPLDAGSDDDDERFAPIAYLPDPHAEPSEVLAQTQQAQLQDTGLKSALASLDERSRTIVQRRWLTEGDSATLHELAAEYGVSAERIRQIEAKAMQKMRGMLAAVA